PHAQGTRSAGAGCTRTVESCDWRQARHQRSHGEVPPGVGLRQAWRTISHRRGPPRARPRPHHDLRIPVPQSDDELLDAYSMAVVGATELVGPAVVKLDIAHEGRRGRREGSGSGLVFAPDGLVLTNCHVVDGATSISVRFADGTTLDGSVLGSDADTDLAVVR